MHLCWRIRARQNPDRGGPILHRLLLSSQFQIRERFQRRSVRRGCGKREMAAAARRARSPPPPSLAKCANFFFSPEFVAASRFITRWIGSRRGGGGTAPPTASGQQSAKGRRARGGGARATILAKLAQNSWQRAKSEPGVGGYLCSSVSCHVVIRHGWNGSNAI